MIVASTICRVPLKPSADTYIWVFLFMLTNVQAGHATVASTARIVRSTPPIPEPRITAGGMITTPTIMEDNDGARNGFKVHSVHLPSVNLRSTQGGTGGMSSTCMYSVGLPYCPRAHLIFLRSFMFLMPIYVAGLSHPAYHTKNAPATRGHRGALRLFAVFSCDGQGLSLMPQLYSVTYGLSTRTTSSANPSSSAGAASSGGLPGE